MSVGFANLLKQVRLSCCVDKLTPLTQLRSDFPEFLLRLDLTWGSHILTCKIPSGSKTPFFLTSAHCI